MPQLLTLVLLIFTVCGCGKEDRNFDTNPALQDLDGDGFGYYEDCDDTNASIGQPEAGCAPGGICSDDSKCASQVCDLSNSEVRGTQRFGRCQSPSCDDETQNGSESDVDCGGECEPCAERKLCESNTDCETRTCLEGRCSAPACGDGVVNGVEQCDDGNRSNTDACTNECVDATCGDGITRLDIAEGEPGFESCDDANQVNDDACRNSCRLPSCGDGLLDDSEACDDGNAVNDDACGNICQLTRCGDSIVQIGEECDDGNTADDDACTNLCRNAYCGDGILRTGLPSSDANYEACDDGNADNTDACLNTCVVASCGDGFVGPGEQCDAAEQNTDTCSYGVQSCTVCSTECQMQSGETKFCGDGVLQPRDGEVCDDAGDGRCLTNCGGCDALFAGDTCDRCVAGANFAMPACVSCLPGFAGDNCDECAPRFTGPTCEQCAPGVAGENCDECVRGGSNPGREICLDEQVCREGLCVAPETSNPQTGDLVFTEIMYNPGGIVRDADGEYFEIVNVSGQPKWLGGCLVSDSSGLSSLLGILYAEVDSILLFARNDDPVINGGLMPASVFDFSLSQLRRLDRVEMWRFGHRSRSIW